MTIRRIIETTLIFIAGNVVWAVAFVPLPRIVFLLVYLLVFALYLTINIIPTYESRASFRLNVLLGGCELVICAMACVLMEIASFIVLLVVGNLDLESLPVFGVNLLTVSLIYFVVFLNGFIRILATSRQLNLFWKAMLLVLWWCPVVDFVLFWKVGHAAYLEYMTELAHEELQNVRTEGEACATRYPLVLVHGIFFRDWSLVNYWGRIPAALKRNGAVVYYGKQQSAATVEQSAAELKQQMARVLEETGAAKVNIVAHSKGGLDARYAISCLGEDEHVASLTTINTPHHGVVFAERLVMTLPKGVVAFVARRYNKIFGVLGDTSPDFLAGVGDLFPSRCEALNRLAPDKSGVFYQSVMSRMRGMTSAGFPLNLAYLLAHRYEGDNDGLVSLTSGSWSGFLGVCEGSGRRGISHGDMIDLTRENIRGFDVRNFYIDLVAGLKNRGL